MGTAFFIGSFMQQCTQMLPLLVLYNSQRRSSKARHNKRIVRLR